MTREEWEQTDAGREAYLYRVYCHSCAYALAKGEWVKLEGDYCPDCYRVWAESFRPWLATHFAHPTYVEIDPALRDGMERLAFAEKEPTLPYRDGAVDDLELLGRGVDVLAEAAFMLACEAKEMTEQLSGCDWCCGGGDERMTEIREAFDHINEQAKEMSR